MTVAQQNTREGTLELASASFAAIKRPDDDGLDGLDALVRGHAAQRVEAKREIKIKHRSKIKSVLRKFQYFCNHSRRNYLFIQNDAEEYLDKRVTEVLTPNEISAVFQTMLFISDDEKNVIDWESGRFVSKLIQLSYDAGNNDFVLDTRSSQRIVYKIGKKLKGNEKRLIRIKIYGDASDLCCYSSHFEVDIDGNVPFGAGSEGIAYNSEYGTIILRGREQHKVADYYYYGAHIIYKTTNKRVLPRLIIDVIDQWRRKQSTRIYNQVSFITPNGKEKFVVKVPNEYHMIYVNREYYPFVKRVLEQEGLLSAYYLHKLNKLDN